MEKNTNSICERKMNGFVEFIHGTLQNGFRRLYYMLFIIIGA